MKKLAIVTAFLALFLTAATAADISKSDLNKQIDQTNFAVGNPTFCSATLIDVDRKLLLTANHCIDMQFETVEREKIGYDGSVKTEKIRVAKPGLVSQLEFGDNDIVKRTDYTFKIILNDSDLDLALVEVKGNGKLPNAMKAAIACKAPERGDDVYAVGNSYGVMYASLTKGIVSSTDRNYRMFHIDQGDHGLTQFSAQIVGGNSGGALYDSSGELIGVNVRGGATGFGLAVPLGDIKKFLMRREGLTDLWKRCNGQVGELPKAEE